MSFAEKGAVADIDPAFFMGYLHRQKATGTLKFEDAPLQRAIYFREGRILFSSSNAPEDQLGAILVAGGKISQEQFDRLVATLEPKQSIAAALAQGGHLAQRDIGDAARRKVEQIVGSCCAQTSGRYEFEDGVLPKGALDLKLTTEKVLVSAFEALEPSGFLMRILKSPMAVLAPGEVTPVEPDLVRLRDALDGYTSLADTGGQVGLSPAATEARAAVLVVLGGATVVTSQIEEMALPEIGEGSLGLDAGAPDDLASYRAETAGFGSKGASPGFSGDSTLTMGPIEEQAPSESGDATLVMPSGLDLSARDANDSGVFRAGGPKRATTQDLAAVKELIGTSISESPSESPEEQEPPSIEADEQEPHVLSSTSPPGPARAGLGGLVQNPIARLAAGLILLSLVAFAVWAGYSNQIARPGQTAAVPVASTPVPEPPVAAPSVPPSSGAPATTATAPTAGATAQQSAARAPLSAQPPVGASSESSYEAMKSGRLAEAATAFEKAARLRSRDFSVQILVACSPQTIAKAIENDPSTDLFILPAVVASKPCYRVMRGFFPSKAEAVRSMSTLPAYYSFEGARPKAVGIGSVLR